MSTGHNHLTPKDELMFESASICKRFHNLRRAQCRAHLSDEEVMALARQPGYVVRPPDETRRLIRTRIWARRHGVTVEVADDFLRRKDAGEHVVCPPPTLPVAKTMKAHCKPRSMKAKAERGVKRTKKSKQVSKSSSLPIEADDMKRDRFANTLTLNFDAPPAPVTVTQKPTFTESVLPTLRIVKAQGQAGKTLRITPESARRREVLELAPPKKKSTDPDDRVIVQILVTERITVAGHTRVVSHIEGVRKASLATRMTHYGGDNFTVRQLGAIG